MSVAVDHALQQAVVTLGDEVVVLKVGEWSGWVPVDFTLSMPSFLPLVPRSP